MVCGHPLAHKQLTGRHCLQRRLTVSIHCHEFLKRMGIVGPSSIHVEILTGLISCRYYTGIPHYCELIWAVAMPYLEVRNPKISFWYTSLYLKFPEPGMMEGWHRWPIYNWVLKILCNCYFDQLWISAWITAHYKKTCLWSKLRAKQVYGHEHKHLECSLIAWPFSKTSIPTPGLWNQEWAFVQTWFYSTMHKILPMAQDLYLIRSSCLFSLLSCHYCTRGYI